MTQLEKLFLWASLFIYAFSFIFYLISLVMNKKERYHALADILLITGFAFETATIAVRWYTTGHLPTVGGYEYALAATWFIILFTLLIIWKQRTFRYVAVLTTISSVLFLGSGITTNPSLKPLTASMMSNWLLIHVLFSWIGFAAYVIACGMGIIYILKKRSRSDGLLTDIIMKFPDVVLLDDMMFKYIVVGFVNHLISIVSGSIWAKDLWGSYWSWDPVEVWSLVTWLLYGLIIHLKISLRWSAERLAYLCMLGVVGAIISWMGISLVVNQSLHMFKVE